MGPVAVAGICSTDRARPLLEHRAPFLTFVPAVLFAMLYGGRGPALFSGFLSLAGGLTFAIYDPGNYAAVSVEALLFVLVCWGIGAMGNRLARQQRNAEAAAERATATGEELKLLLEGATRYAIFMVDPAGRVTTWNSGAQRILGWSEGDMLGEDCARFYPADSWRKAEAVLARALAEGRYTEESWTVRKDGSEFLADTTITPLRRSGGELRGFAKVIHDVTERRAAERALEKRERHLQSILATVPEAMVVIDEQGTMISFSAAAEGCRVCEEVSGNVSC